MFLDVDGTLRETKGFKPAPNNVKEIRLLAGVKTALERWNQRGFVFGVVTNQGGVESGYLTKEEALECLEFTLRKFGIHDAPTIVSTTMKPDDPKRKPNPWPAGLIVRAYVEDGRVAEVDERTVLRRSIMVGDRETDRQFAVNAGIGGFLWAADWRAGRDYRVEWFEHWRQESE
jgi:histidinol phosphatase-like enzyme